MELSSVRALKQQLAIQTLPRARAAAKAQRRGGLERAGTRSAESVALGIAAGETQNDYRLAVRVQGPTRATSAIAEQIQSVARGEADIRYVRDLVKRTPWHQRRQRPLLVGSSIAHFDVTAGTLGAFVARRNKDGATYVLSNNHVLANEDNCGKDDVILQQSPDDGGFDPDEKVAGLASWIKLRFDRPNLYDAAIGLVEEGMDYDPTLLRGGTVGLAGLRKQPIAPKERVWKLGRTTGLTRGIVTATELDGVIVGYDIGDLSFDNQIEIVGANNSLFCDGGDSGSLIMDREGFGCGLLFAGGYDRKTRRDLTYANPLHGVLDRLKVDLVF